MKTKIKLIFLIQSSVIYLMICGCASTQDIQQYHTTEGFNAPFDEVWSALNWVIFEDMKCSQKKVSKKKGFIETEWTYIIGMDGTTRWKITARAEHQKESVLVQINKMVQLRDNLSRNINMYRQKTRGSAEPRAGWKTEGPDKTGAEEIYLKIKNRLNNNTLMEKKQ